MNIWRRFEGNPFIAWMFCKPDFFRGVDSSGVDIFLCDDIFSRVDFVREADTFRGVDYFGVDIFRNNICHVGIHVRYNIFIEKEPNKLFSAWIPREVFKSTEYKQHRNFCGKEYRCRFMAFYWNLPDKLVWIYILPIKHFCKKGFKSPELVWYFFSGYLIEDSAVEKKLSFFYLDKVFFPDRQWSHV